MRVSTNLFFDRALSGILDTQSGLSKTQQQLSSGQRIVTPADDPIAATQVLNFEQEISIIEQYQNNIDGANYRLSIEETVLNSVEQSLLRVRDIAIQANSGALSAEDRELLAAEVRQRLDQMVDLLNTRDANGEYLFAGFQGGNQPFVERGAVGFEYFGDEGQRFSQVSASNQIAISDPGKKIFVDIETENTTFQTSASRNNAGNANISIGRVIDQTAWDAVVPADYTITFNSATDYSITNAADGSPVIGTNPPGPLTSIPYVQGQDIEINGIQFNMVDVPIAGDTFFIESSDKQDILTSVERIAFALENLANSANITPTDGQTLGVVTTPAVDLATAGNGISAQTISVLTSGGQAQTVIVNSGDTAQSIAAALDAVDGVNIIPITTQATLDINGTVGNENDTIQFSLNGTQVRAQIGATNAATYTNVTNAITAATGGNFNVINNLDGTFDFEDAAGNHAGKTLIM